MAGAFCALVGCPSGVEPDALHVQPLVVNFGGEDSVEQLLVRNEGAAPLTYSVTDNADWLSLGRTGGVLAGAETQQVALTVDRTGLGLGVYRASVNVRSGLKTETVSVSMSVAGTPGLDVIPRELVLSDGATSGAIAIQNTGSGRLTWSAVFFDPETGQEGTELLSGAFTLTPLGGSLEAGGTATLTLDVDRDLLEDQPGTFTFGVRIKSNAGSVDVEVRVTQGDKPVVAIDTDPDDGEFNAVSPAILDFGEDRDVMTCFVWNSGPVSTDLVWTLESDREGGLVSFEPQEEQESEGTNSVFQVDPDKVTEVTVTVNRDFMEGLEDSAIITVTPEGAAEPQEILINVSKAPIRFEGALNRSRPPFIMRFLFLMRDSGGKPIELTPEILADPTSVFSLWEDERRIDLDETNVFVRSAAGLRRDVVVLLDYTGSMSVAQREYAGAKAADDPLHLLYAGAPGEDGVVDAMLDDVLAISPPPSVALMEYHERQQTRHVIHPFSTDAESIQQELEDFDLPEAERGGSALFDSIIYACEQLAIRGNGLLPLDEADVRALYVITDGEDTSSIASADEASTVAQDNRVRVHIIGYGEDVPAVDLIKIASETGGHYYAATGEDRGDRLEELMESRPDWSPDAGQLAYELERQVVLNYNTLFQEGSHTYRITAQIDDNTGSFEKDAVFAIGGDVRAGQISLWTNGTYDVEVDVGGATEIRRDAVVYVRTEYLPRNIYQFLFRLWVEQEVDEDELLGEKRYSFLPIDPSNVEVLYKQTSQGEYLGGELLDADKWSGQPILDNGLYYITAAYNDATGELDYTGQNADTVLLFLTANQEDPLAFSDFGALLKVTVQDIQGDAALHFRVDNSLYRDPPFTKFFQYPDSIPLTAGPVVASEVPILIEEGFNPDADGAWNRDGDEFLDFDDIRPEDEEKPGEMP